MVTDTPELALIDSVLMPLAEARIPVTDEGLARGDGAFETVGVWDGRPFRLDDHLDRLDSSLDRLLLPPSDRKALADDIDRILEGVDGDAALRCFVTASGTRIVTLSPQPVRQPARRLMSVPAPWIVPTTLSASAGAKSMSYGPNMVATRTAQRAGGDDALLVAADGTVLEGPTFTVLWVAGGTLCTVPLERGVVPSVSRRALLEIAEGAGVPTREAEMAVGDVVTADEVLICSSIRPVIALERIDDVRLPGKPVMAERLGNALEAARRARPIA